MQTFALKESNEVNILSYDIVCLTKVFERKC